LSDSTADEKPATDLRVSGKFHHKSVDPINAGLRRKGSVMGIDRIGEIFATRVTSHPAVPALFPLHCAIAG
jgi:hypothetical protein